jgi:hypothetical protein
MEMLYKSYFTFLVLLSAMMIYFEYAYETTKITYKHLQVSDAKEKDSTTNHDKEGFFKKIDKTISFSSPPENPKEKDSTTNHDKEGFFKKIDKTVSFSSPPENANKKGHSNTDTGKPRVSKEINSNYEFFEKYKAIALFNTLTKQNKNTTYLFASFVEPTNGSKLAVMNAIYAGYANRVYQVIDALIASLLTDRIALINFDTNGPHALIDLPSVTDSYVYEPSIWDQNSHLTQGWQPVKNATRLMQTVIPEESNIIKIGSASPHFFETCSNSKYFGKLLAVGAVQNKTIERALDIQGRSNEEQLNRLFQVGFEAAGYVLKKRWPLRPHVLALVNQYKSEYFDGSFVIGLQIRGQYVNEANKDDIKFIDCALGIESEFKETKPVKWLIVTDMNHMFSKISQLMPNKTIFTSNGTAGHGIGNGDYQQTIKAFLDIELLSLCDEIIQTSGSTFGFISAIKAQKLPYYVNGTAGCGDRCKDMKGCEKMTLARPHKRHDQYDAAVY